MFCKTIDFYIKKLYHLNTNSDIGGEPYLSGKLYDWRTLPQWETVKGGIPLLRRENEQGYKRLAYFYLQRIFI